MTYQEKLIRQVPKAYRNSSQSDRSPGVRVDQADGTEVPQCNADLQMVISRDLVVECGHTCAFSGHGNVIEVRTWSKDL